MSTKMLCSAICCGILLLAGCTEGEDYLNLSPDVLGEANRQTFAAQIIDPNPEYAELNPATSGDHAAGAIERYRAGAVKKPERQQTSNVGSTGGGSGGGN